MGRSPNPIDKKGVKTDGLVLFLSADQEVYSRFDTIVFTFTILNKRGSKVVSEQIFSDFVEPSSSVALIATDEKGNRFSGYAGNRTDPGEDFDHYSIQILPKKMLAFNLFHRDMQRPLYVNDKSFPQISDKPGTYTINALLQKDLFKTKFPLISNKIKITILKK